MHDKPTFTKLLIGFVMATYFVGFIVGGILIIFYPEHLSDWLLYIGTPATAAIGFYCWKAKAENVIRIRNSLKTELSDIPTLGETIGEPLSLDDQVNDILSKIEEEKYL